MKKLVLGLAVCCGISGANGSELEGLADEVGTHPRERIVLRDLVDLLTGSNNVIEDCETVIDRFEDLESREWDIDFRRIYAMVLAIRRDFSCYGYVLSSDYYCNGARSGMFGPYNIPDDVEY